MTRFTKEQLTASAHARIEFAEMMLAGELEPLKERTWSIELELARIALASLEAQAVMYAMAGEALDTDAVSTCRAVVDAWTDEWNQDKPGGTRYKTVPLYSTPPAPVLPEELLSAMEEVLRISDRDHEAWHQARAGIVACRAATYSTTDITNPGYKPHGRLAYSVCFGFGEFFADVSFMPTDSAFNDGVTAAANWVDKQRESYDNEHGRTDNDTGTFEFGNDAQRDYSESLLDIAEGIRNSVRTNP